MLLPKQMKNILNLKNEVGRLKADFFYFNFAQQIISVPLNQREIF